MQNFREWANDTVHECGTLTAWGRLVGVPCTSNLPYFCERPLGSPRKCGQGWEKFGDSCYKVCQFLISQKNKKEFDSDYWLHYF